MPLEDKDPMPFGMYKGRKMEDVPASYLMWFKEHVKYKAANKRLLAEKLVLKYIESNEDAILKEIKEKSNTNGNK